MGTVTLTDINVWTLIQVEYALDLSLTTKRMQLEKTPWEVILSIKSGFAPTTKKGGLGSI